MTTKSGTGSFYKCRRGIIFVLIPRRRWILHLSTVLSVLRHLLIPPYELIILLITRYFCQSFFSPLWIPKYPRESVPSVDIEDI